MKYRILLILLMLTGQSFAQKISLTSGDIDLNQGLENIENFDWAESRFLNQTYVIFQFDRSTSRAERNDIENQTGIRFFDYLPVNGFIASIPSNLNVNLLTQIPVKGITPYIPDYKISEMLIERPLPDWILLDGEYIQVDVTIHNNVYRSIAESEFATLNIEVLTWEKENRAEIKIKESQIEDVTRLPFVKYISPTSAPGIPENDEGRTNHRINLLDSDYPGGRHYNGNGIAVCMGDDGGVGPHIDFRGRMVDLSSSNLPGNTHGDHVLGIVGGAGNFDPSTEGNAVGADLIVRNGYGNLNNATNDYATYGVRITTNSLGQSCNAGYNNDAVDQDDLINSLPSLISVHSAGNSGTSSCGGVNGYKNITGGYKAAKNCLAVGNLQKSDVIANSSSRGPAKDGRIKPDICATGTSINSTQPGNTYDVFTGTSMACPGVAGSLAVLWEAYKNLNLGQDPSSDLIKGVVLNTAQDLGNPGPDYIYGWGRINARRAVEVLENTQYKYDSVDNAQAKVFNIPVIAGISQLKVMVYWNDPSGAPNATTPLVNNINMNVQDPNTTVYNPWILSTTPTVAALSANATRGIDNINNVEQVTIDNPIPGNYTVNVSGFNIPLGPQRFILVYDYVVDEIKVTYPNGGEHFEEGHQETVRWDASFGNGMFTVEYSSDNGISWNTLSTTVPAGQRFYTWNPPTNLNTGQMKVRVSRGTQSDESDTLFTVYQVPQNLTVDTACNSYFHLIWDPVPGASDYTVYMLGTKYMDPIGTTATTDFSISSGINVTDTFYFAVSANIVSNGALGRRSIAYCKLPGKVNCGDDLVNLATSIPIDRAYDCANLSSIPVSMLIKNNSITGAPISNIPVGFNVNGGGAVSEFYPGTLNFGDSVWYTFTNTANFFTNGLQTVKTWVAHPIDGFANNDTSFTTMYIIPDYVVTAPYVEDFEGANFPPSGWQRLDPDGGVKWQKTIVVSGPTTGSTHTAYMDFFNYTSIGQYDIMESPFFDLQGVTNDSVLMTFDLSHVNRADKKDSLQILVSTDCGASFMPTAYHKGGSDLATSFSSNAVFSPTTTLQWRNESVDLSAYKGLRIMLQFKARNDNGNNAFIDNINMILKDAWPLGTTPFNGEHVKVYPNPGDGHYIMEMATRESKTVFYQVRDMKGAVVFAGQVNLTPGISKTAVDLSDLPSGMYGLQVFDGTNQKLIKLLKQ